MSGPAPVAVTSGEPAGIGPELCARLAAEFTGSALVILCDRPLFEARARHIGIDIALPDYRRGAPGVSLLHVPAPRQSSAGAVDAGNAPYVIAMLDLACDGCERGEFAAMVTAPVHKAVIMEAGYEFRGHTEHLADRLGVAQVVMMLVGGGMRVALATTHVPLAEVPCRITREGLAGTLRILDADLRERFAIASPRIVVAGLNPHAGESGRMGREEIEVIEPVLQALRAEGMTLVGPLPADTLFQRKVLGGADAVLAMYHDQGLPVLKYASFGAGVNVTLGLPIVRTSVDHGTALELAGTGRADVGSLRAALELATDLAVRRQIAIPAGGER